VEIPPFGTTLCLGLLIELAALLAIGLAGARARAFAFIAASVLGVCGIAAQLAYLLVSGNSAQLDEESRLVMLDALLIAVVFFAAAAWVSIAIGVRRALRAKA
jgi:hypothetical protein